MILGVDLSLARTGLAIYRDHHGVPDLELRSIDGSKLRGMERVSRICKEIWSLTTGDPACLIVIEDYAYVKDSSAMTGLAELRGVLLYSLWCWSASVVAINPVHLKIYLTGRARSGTDKESGETVSTDKDAVVLAAQKRYGHLADIRNNDQADALGLVAMAADQYGAPLATVPATHRRALAGAKDNPTAWPTTFRLGGDRVATLATTGGLL